MNKLADLLLSYIGSCLPFPDQILKLNGRDFRIIQELGEGGFSKVYLIRDVNSHQLYTIKKVYIIKGEEELAQITFKEIDLLRSFQNEGIIKVLDVQVQQVADGSRIIYIFLPYYEKGTLQDLIASIANKTREPLSESEILQIFLSLSKTVKFLHNYELPRVEVNHSPLKMRPPSLDITQEDSILLEDESVQHEQQSASSPTADISPYAHKDLKPGNVLLDEGNIPILIDFGSCEKARVNVKNSHQALTEQEKAEKYSTILFRAPELFDVQPGSKLDEKVDIWSLGCILYNMAYLKSPFEFGATEHGGSIALSVMNGKFYIPSNSSYSKAFNKLIKQILITDVDKRPDIDQVIQLTNELLNQGN